MRQPISVKREHPAKPMIPDVSTATGTNSKSATSWGYFRLFKSSAALDAEPGFRVKRVYRVIAHRYRVYTLWYLPRELRCQWIEKVMVYNFFAWGFLETFDLFWGLRNGGTVEKRCCRVWRYLLERVLMMECDFTWSKTMLPVWCTSFHDGGSLFSFSHSWWV